MNAAAGLVEVRVPDMGNFKDVAIIDVLVKPGDTIEPEAPLVTLETEKATMDVPSTASGVIEKIHVAKGGTVSTGDLIATVRSNVPAGAGGAAAVVDPIDVSRVWDHAGAVAHVEQAVHGFAAVITIVEGALVHVHAHELVGEIAVEVAREMRAGLNSS